MRPLDAIASAIVVLTGLYFVWLGVFAVALPRRAADFLGSFASSARAHYAELFVRLAVGLAFIRSAGEMAFAPVFSIFGWVLLATTSFLFFVPWRWHRRFAQRSVPYAVHYLKLVAAASFLLGIFVLACAAYAAY